VSVVRDITERKRGEEVLQQKTLELQQLTESLEERVRERTRELAELSLQLVSAQEKERERISYELHDQVWQNLVAIRMEMELLFSGRGDRDWKDLQNRSQKLMAEMLETVLKIRAMQGDLWPYVLDDIGLVATLDWYCREFGKSHPGLAVQIKDGVTEAEILPAAKIVIYRILQEALNNVTKHSRADRVDIRLTARDHSLEFSIADNGVGFDLREAIAGRSPWGGLGLLSIKARTELSGGDFEVESAKGKGTRVRAIWPV
jgi:signal transduction histidine kinase